jgi:hypothetical protein
MTDNPGLPLPLNNITQSAIDDATKQAAPQAAPAVPQKQDEIVRLLQAILDELQQNRAKANAVAMAEKHGAGAPGVVPKDEKETEKKPVAASLDTQGHGFDQMDPAGRVHAAALARANARAARQGKPERFEVAGDNPVHDNVAQGEALQQRRDIRNNAVKPDDGLRRPQDGPGNIDIPGKPKVEDDKRASTNQEWFTPDNPPPDLEGAGGSDLLQKILDALNVQIGYLSAIKESSQEVVT